MAGENEEVVTGGESGGAGEGSFDMASAVEEVGDGLGLGAEEGGEEDQPAQETAEPSKITSEPVSEKAAQRAGEGATPPPETASPTAPRTWRPEAAAQWAQIPPVVQAEILKREEDVFNGIESYKAAAEFGAPLKQVLEPYLPILAQHGIKPDAQVADMMRAHYTLAFGSPAEKIALIRQVIKDYSVPVEGVSGEPEPGYVDPQVAGLQRELNELKSHISRQDTAQIEAKRQEITRQVESFAADPKNAYFEELATDIAHLLRTGAQPTVEKAYEAAMWLNPAVRAKELAKQQAEREAKAKKEAEEKAAQARKATAANVRTKARGGSAAAPLGSMDETLATTLAAINSRS